MSSWTNFEIQRYYQIESRFYSVYWSNNLPKNVKKMGHVINLDEYVQIQNITVTWFSFGAEPIKTSLVIKI